MKKLFLLLAILGGASLSFADQEVTIDTHAEENAVSINLNPGEHLIVHIPKEDPSWTNQGGPVKSHRYISPEFKDENYWMTWGSSHHLDFSFSTNGNPMSYDFAAMAPGKTTLFFSNAAPGSVIYIQTRIEVTVLSKSAPTLSPSPRSSI